MPQFRIAFDGAPPELETHRLANAINSIATEDGEKMQASVRLVQPGEMAHLHRFKGGDGPTNVLTFVGEASADIAICLQVAEDDAMSRGWDLNSELNYLCIHGCLHALGFDHGDRKSATEMEGLERQILAGMGLDTSALDP